MKKLLSLLFATLLFAATLLAGCCSSRQAAAGEQDSVEQSGSEFVREHNPRRGVPPEHCRITAVVDTISLTGTLNGKKQYLVKLQVESVTGIGSAFIGDVHEGATIKASYRLPGTVLRIKEGARVAAEMKSPQVSGERSRQYILISIDPVSNND